ncbi:MAG: hypothetical protein ABEJ83_00310 [Candidatus Nanohaloarchaea archaeon]
MSASNKDQGLGELPQEIRASNPESYGRDPEYSALNDETVKMLEGDQDSLEEQYEQRDPLGTGNSLEEDLENVLAALNPDNPRELLNDPTIPDRLSESELRDYAEIQRAVQNIQDSSYQ